MPMLTHDGKLAMCMLCMYGDHAVQHIHLDLAPTYCMHLRQLRGMPALHAAPHTCVLQRRALFQGCCRLVNVLPVAVAPHMLLTSIL